MADDESRNRPEAGASPPPVRRPWVTPTVILPTRAVRMTEKTATYPVEIHTYASAFAS